VNCLIYNCGTYLIGNFAGGSYEYTHCTVSNHQSLFISDEPFVQFSDNIVLEDGQILTEDLQVTLTNNIIWGSGQNELLLNNGGGSMVAFLFNSNIIRTNEEIENNYTSTEFNFPGLNTNYALDTLSFAKDRGMPGTGIMIDILGEHRDERPDIGAFERIEN